MPVDSELKRAIEEIKLRASIEEIVRERLPELRKRGRLWEACCPFHEERTPSFKVDPSRATWRCYGACQRGGDVLSFVQESQNLAFGDALELLAARTGVELPRRRRQERADDDPALGALATAEEFFREALRGPEGRAAREYLKARGFGPNTVEAFGLGWAPRSGAALLAHAKRSGGAGGGAVRGGMDIWEKVGLLRRGDDGSPYSFFRGRLIVPIRDLKGRTVGFGARRLEDGEGSGPKYVNTPETPWFHKGRLIYGLDRAVDHVRRGGHLVLVEGYTDVMAAHQAGVPTVCAVLGTATTDDHAALVRRSGARRVSLVFDGDAAGRSAAWKALYGLLPLDVEIVVATLPGGADPADVLAEGGAEPFLAQLELAREWYDFVVSGLDELGGKDLAREVDRILELFDRLPKPVQRDAMMRSLAERLGMPLDTVREAWRALPERRREALRAADGDAEGRRGRVGSPGSGAVGTGSEDSSNRGPARRVGKPVDPKVVAAYKAAVGAVLEDPALVPRVRLWAPRCPSAGLKAVLEVLLELFEDDDAELDPSAVMTALGDHPVRDRVLDLVEHARSSDFPPHQLLDENLAFLEQHARRIEQRRLQALVGDLSARAETDPGAQAELERALTQLTELSRGGTPAPTAGPASASAPGTAPGPAPENALRAGS